MPEEDKLINIARATSNALQVYSATEKGNVCKIEKKEIKELLDENTIMSGLISQRIKESFNNDEET
jgi:hypothetical protein